MDKMILRMTPDLTETALRERSRSSYRKSGPGHPGSFRVRCTAWEARKNIQGTNGPEKEQNDLTLGWKKRKITEVGSVLRAGGAGCLLLLGLDTAVGNEDHFAGGSG